MTRPHVGLYGIFDCLAEHFGPQYWWPANTPFEVAVGAILTQNTTWANVERAIANLRSAGALEPAVLATLAPAAVEEMIRPAGFFRQKRARLQHLAVLLAADHVGDITLLCAGPLEEVRDRLLALPGIGAETADAILLYAGHRPTFVVDAYTRRVFSRLGLLHGRESYASIRARFMSELPHEASLFNEYHALIVALAKRCCRKQRPTCSSCPLRLRCSFAIQSSLNSG